jgi:hypothetical protein
MNVMKRTKVSRYAAIVLELDPLSCDRYLVRKSVRYLEKSVGFMVLDIRKHVQANPIDVLQQLRVHLSSKSHVRICGT